LLKICIWKAGVLSEAGYTWTDGTPTLAATNTTTGIFVGGAQNGFRLTVPATPTRQQLKVYVGLYGARGRLEACLPFR
jgi:spore maturation protein SpmB